MDKNREPVDGDIRAATSTLKEGKRVQASIGGRSWKGFFRYKGSEFLKKTGVTVTLLGGGIAFNETAMPERRAEGGIVTSESVDPQIRAYGEQYSVAGGGSVGHIAANGSTTTHASGVYLGNGWVLTAGHVVALGGSLTFGTGFNFNTNPGSVYSPLQVVLHPNYSNLGNRDIALIRYPTIATNSVLTIATSRPAIGSDVWLAGYGTTGTPAGYTIQDGYIRAGTSRMSSGSSLLTLGYDPSFFSAANMRTATRPFDIRAYRGDSGGGVFLPSGELFGLMIAAGNSPTNDITIFLDLTYPDTRSWIDSVINPVPEPSSMLFVGVSLLISAATYRRRFAST